MRILVQAQVKKEIFPPNYEIIEEGSDDYFDFLLTVETEQPQAFVIEDGLFSQMEDELLELCANRYFIAVITQTNARRRVLKRKGYYAVLEKNANSRLKGWLKTLPERLEEIEVFGTGKKVKVKFPATIQNRVIAVCKGRAGDGGTTLAANLAVRLAALNKKIKIVLLDGDLRNPNLADHLNLYRYLKEKKETGEKFDFSEIIPLSRGKRLTDIHLEKITVPYRKNLDIICGTDEISKINRLSEENVEELFNLLRKKYNYVIVDCSSHITELITYVALVEESTDILWTLTSDYCSRKRTVKNIRELQELGVDLKKFLFILNKYTKGSLIPVQRIRQELSDLGNITQTIRFTDYMLESLDKGKPLVLSSKKVSEYTEQIDKIIIELLKREAE